jgi:uncharacterized protein YjaG (DUF416 family)
VQINLASSLINPAIDTLDSVSGSLKNLTEISSLQDQIKSTNNSLNTLSDLNNSDKQISDLNLNVTSFMVQYQIFQLHHSMLLWNE